MKFINIIVEGSSEENFVNDVLNKHFSSLEIYISARKIKTGWDQLANKPAKGGLSNYIKFRNDVMRWIDSERNRADTWYTSMIDLYAFPKDHENHRTPYTKAIQVINDPYEKITALEAAIAEDIDHPKFIPYVQLHEFEAFLLADPDRLVTMYPNQQAAINQLRKDIEGQSPERINESPQGAPSKRIIKYLPDYAGQKDQIGPLVAGDIGLTKLRDTCSHFNEWMNKLEAV